ncbi:MAG: hypothetical protein LQ339_008544 [Xanthoria mediterranea]|nr:MAG: hypothetical protein LQ339_008544 [Xanthoria mediterranea]
MRVKFHRSNKDKDTDGKVPHDQPDDGDAQELRLRPTDGQGLWQQAWKAVKKDVDWELPESMQHAESLSTKDEVEALHKEAQDRRYVSESNQRHIWRTKYTYREVCDKVSSYAQKFEFVGDMVTQAEPVYAALPWTAIRFVINCAVGESETYHNILDGTEFISGLIVQYPAIEQIYAKIDSESGNELRKSLLHLYKLILRFQLYSIRYFDPKHKIARTFAGLNPVKAETIKAQLAGIEKAKQKADSDIGLVDAEVTKVGIDNIKEGQADQKQSLELIKDTLRALSGDTASFVHDQREWMSEFDQTQQARTEAFVEMWKAPLEDLKQKLEQERVQREKENLYSVRRWLSRAEPETDYAEAKGKRLMDLGDWLIEKQTFKDWRSSTLSSLLWLHGFAGTGKTGLVCRVLHEIRTSLGNADPTQGPGRLAFFYCSSDKPSTGREVASRSDPREALRSIVSQLSTSQHGRSVPPIVQEKYEDYGPGSDSRRALNDAECVEIIAEVAKHTPITIVLDAFDELDQAHSHQLVQIFKDINTQCPENVKIFISTRSFPAIEDSLKADASIEVTAENNGGDVKTFIQRTLQHSIDEKLLLDGAVSEQLQSDIENTLTKRAQNMFLYASLLLNQLCDKNKTDDEESIRKKLEGLPKDITEAYNQIMVEVHDNKGNSERSCSIAQNAFKWLLCAQENLDHDAFLEAVSPPEKKADNDELLRACRTLVARGRKTYEPAHYSVREHIGRMGDYTSSKCHIVATMSCLSVLTKMFRSDSVDHDLSPSEKAFGQYALLYWPLHYESIHQHDLSEHRSAVNTLLRALLLQGRSKVNKYESWYTQASERAKSIKHNDLATKYKALNASPLTPLFAAAVFGLEDLVSKFGRELDELNKCNGHGQTALCLAIQNNKLGVVKALLTSRFPADINLLNVNAVQQFDDWDNKRKPEVILYASALQCAAANGMLEIAEFLIDHDAHVDLVAGYYGSPLQAAALNGHARVVELLLKHNAEPNSQGGYFGNALQAAAAAGHVDIINLLLEHKPPAVVSAPGGRYGSALMAAICSGSSDTVFALLEEKANPNLRSKVHGKPLEKAADMGHSGKEIVKDLLEFKAEADLSPKREDFHILHKAAMYGMQELGSYCLENGCDIGMKTTKGPSYHRRFGDFAQEMTPLAYASAEGNLGMVRLLLNRGASLERGKDPSGVLWIAAYQGHADVVDILIKTFKQNHSSEATARFIDQRPTRRSGHPILWAACSSSSPETVRVLLDHGAKYESNWYKVTPLLATATFARPNVAKTLLEYHRRGKIDVCLNQRANNGRTALYEACENNRQRILEQLLDAGADYTIRDDHDCTPLHAGTHHDAIGVLTLLYKKAHEEMDEDALEDFMNARSKGGQTALIQAVDRNKLPHASFLLDCGADYTIAGHLGNTPLHFACRHGNEQMYKKLIERAKMDDEHQSFQEFLDLRNKDGCTALHRATNEQRVSIVQLLLRHGADFTIANNRDVTPLHGATWRGFKDIMVLILEQAIRQLDVAQFRAFINRRNYAGTTALVDSAKPLRKQFRMDVTTTLLEYGADPTIPRNHEITALHHACFDGRLDLVQLLLDHAQQKFTPTRISAFLNHRNYLGRTALYDAIRSARDNPEIEILQMLLDRGADYAIPNKDGVTTLHAAAFHGNVAVVRMLLSHSSDKDPERFSTYVNARNKSGKTALHDSCDKGRPKVTKLLMDHGIDFTIEDTQGRTALHWCIPRDQIKTMQVLLDEASARETADNGHPSQRFQNFINAARTDGAMTALHDVSVRGDVEMARVLLEHGADFECYDATAQTPLHGGISHGHEAMAILLLEHASRGPGPVEQQKLWRFLKPGSTSALKVTTAKEAAAEKGMGKVVSMIEELERKCEAR